ncbi:MAG: hypothetical protein OXG15_09260 [Gammaproteobacteria bacterium]|nr:hypothetical protein [Gammaproteobacteria bacterium]
MGPHRVLKDVWGCLIEIARRGVPTNSVSGGSLPFASLKVGCASPMFHQLTLFDGSIPVTWSTVDTGDLVYTFAGVIMSELYAASMTASP